MASNAADLARSWFSRQDLGEGVTIFSEPAINPIFCANMFLVEGGERDMVVDFGSGIASLSAAIGPREKPMVPVATHAHSDHVGSFHEFAGRAGPRIEADAFASMDDARTYADEFRALAEPVSRLPHPLWRAADYRLESAPLARYLEEGDVIDLGGRTFRVLHLPGHSPGSIGLWDEASGALFSGDAIYDGRLYDDQPDSDRAVYRATMRRLLELPVRVVYPGHNAPFGHERMVEIAHRYLQQGAG